MRRSMVDYCAAAYMLADSDNKVIALSGRWGTGKSHLWKEVREESNDSAVQRAIGVSLFGLSDMNHLKLKALQNALPKAEDRSVFMEQMNTTLKGARKILEGFHKGFAALDEVALLAAPNFLNGKMIVLDDIERKNEKLSIDEVLGFIDEFTQQHGSRFVLILNDDQLDKRDLWNTLREKVIDQEIRLLTTPKEAFAIAINLNPSRYSEWIEKAVVTCGLTNIRIILKVIRVVNRILGDRELNDEVLTRVIPSMVLLAGINFKGIEDGPDFSFVLSAGSDYNRRESAISSTSEPGRSKNQEKWRQLLGELSIKSCDEFELLVVEYLESGQFDPTAVSMIVERYVTETEALKAQGQANQLFMQLDWDPRLSEADCVEKAEELIALAKHLNPYIASALCSALSQFPGGKEAGEAIVRAWLESFRAQGHQDFNDESPFNRPLHPDIEAEFSAIKGRAQAKLTVFDACNYISEHSAWGTRQEVAMRTATTEAFESTIRSLEMDDFRTFMNRMVGMRVDRQLYDPYFGSAIDRFVEACRNIVTDRNSGRLGSLIKRLFIQANIGRELDLTSISVPASSAAPEIQPGNTETA